MLPTNSLTHSLISMPDEIWFHKGKRCRAPEGPSLVLRALHINSEHQQTSFERKQMINEHQDMLTWTTSHSYLIAMNILIFMLSPEVRIPPEFGMSVLVRWNFLSDFHNVVQPPCIWSCCSASCRRSWRIVMQLRVPANTDFWPLLVLTVGPHFGCPFPFPHSCLLHPAFEF